MRKETSRGGGQTYDMVLLLKMQKQNEGRGGKSKKAEEQWRKIESIEWIGWGRGGERWETKSVFQLSSHVSWKKLGGEMLKEWIGKKKRVRERDCHYCIPEAMFSPYLWLPVCMPPNQIFPSVSHGFLKHWGTSFFPHFYPANQIREIKEGKQAKRQTGDRQRKQMRRRQWRLKRGGRGRGESASLIYLTSLMRVRVSPAYKSMMCLSSLHCRIFSVTLMKLSSEPGPNLRVNWFPRHYDHWLHRIFGMDGEDLPVQIKQLGQLSVWISVTIKWNKCFRLSWAGCRLTTCSVLVQREAWRICSCPVHRCALHKYMQWASDI